MLLCDPVAHYTSSSRIVCKQGTGGSLVSTCIHSKLLQDQNQFTQLLVRFTLRDAVLLELDMVC